MPLSVGDKLGPYEILALIGKGGMGEVYRAHDNRLRRDVAIKVSNSEFSERFTREARVIASLNHTNIAHLYDVGPNYLVMEYVEGEDLKGPLSFDDALPIIQQLIDGIEAAHEKNIIHRDLKPANIKITPDGVVKILDFGLAKAMEPPRDADPSNSPTLTMGATQAGTILGTAAYMSPEQAKGKEADKRADIWSFAVVIYELLTGKRMFVGETAVEILGGVLNKAPDITAAPARVNRLLKWCLEKDRKKRLASISDARLFLAEPPAPPAQNRERNQGKLWPAIAALAALALLVLAAWTFTRPTTEPRPIATTVLPPSNGQFDFNEPYAMPAISPDGTFIVYGAKTQDGKQQLWLRRLDSPTAQPLSGTEDAATPFWSPDSRWIAFGQGTKLKKIAVQGGPPVAIAEVTGSLRGGSWNEQGEIVFGIQSAGRSPLWRVAASGGTAVKIEQAQGRHPWFLPDGRHFLYQATANAGAIFVASLDEPGSPEQQVAQTDSLAAYSQGHLLYLRDNTLMAQPFDPGRVATTGEAMPVAEGIPTYTTGSRIPGFTVSPAGLLLYQSGGAGTQARLVWKDRQGKLLSALPKLHRTSALNLSPDGKRAAVADADRTGGAEDLWLYDLDRGIPTRFTTDPKHEGTPVWSPDGTMLYFSSDRNGTFKIFRRPSNGAGNDEMVLEDSVDVFPSSISPDGKFLMYTRLAEKTGSDQWILPLAAAPGGPKAKPYPFLEEPGQAGNAKFSPDGHWVTYNSNESGQVQTYAVPFPGPGGKIQITANGGGMPRWRKDGREIFYTSTDRELTAVEVSARNGTLEVGQPRKLFTGIITSTTGRSSGVTYDVSPDGQKFLVFDDGANDTTQPLTLVQNWTAMLRK